MTDIYRQPTSGEPFRPSARQTRMLLEGAERVTAARPDPRNVPSGRQGLVLVYNGTGSDFTAARPICGINFSLSSGSMITPAIRASVVHEIPTVVAAAPAATGQQRWCILTGPLKNGSARLGIVGGVSFCRLQVDDEDVAGWARPITNDRTKLLAVDGAFPIERPGVAQILWRAGGTGEQDALVRLPCLVRPATLWKLDPATGEILWQSDRRRDTLGLASYVDGADVYLYESGFDDPDGNYVRKLRDDTIRADELWSVAPTDVTFANPIELQPSDATLWVSEGSGTDLHRLDEADGSEVNTATVSLAPRYMTPAPSDGMFISERGSADYPSGTSLALVSSALSTTTTLSSLNSGRCRLAAGWLVTNNASPRKIREYDDSLSLVAEADSPVASATNRFTVPQRESSDGKAFGLEFNSAGSGLVAWHRIDIATLTSDWSVTPATSVDLQTLGMTADDDVYVLDLGGAIYRLSGADGSTVWSTAVGATGSGVGGWSYHLLRSGDLLLVVMSSSSGQALTYSGATITAMALDAADGTVVWARSLEGLARFTVRPQLINDALYVAGGRTLRGRFPDVVAP